jgi:phosphate/phosphite/phosphonate ABC transporter binding protein
VPVKIVRGTDYAAVIEAMRSGHVQIASVGPAAYALARKIMGEAIAPVAITLDGDGNRGYYSVIAVRADSPYQSLEDIKGQSFAFADRTRPRAMRFRPTISRPSWAPMPTSISATWRFPVAMSRA